MNPLMKYVSERFHEALALASRLHEDQCRKGNAAPYVSHLISVASIVLKNKGSEEQAIAALLHDALEDQADKISAHEIGARFGDKVKILVESCTDETCSTRTSTPWRVRKEKYLDHLRDITAEEMLVIVADKLDNARDIKINYLQVGEDLWPRFSGQKEGLLWYQQELAKVMHGWLERADVKKHPHLTDLIHEFIKTCDEFAQYQGCNPL